MLDAHGHDEHPTFAFERPKKPYRVTPAPVRAETPRTAATRDVSLIDVVYAIIVFGSAIAFLSISRGAYFNGVDWPLATRGGKLGDFLQPLNGSLGVITIGLYRTLYKLVGFDSYTPWHMAAIACLLGLSVALYLVLRRRTGPLIAGVVAIYFLWYPHTGFTPSDLGFTLSAIAAVVAAYALEHEDRTADLTLFGAIVFALISSAAGLALLAAAIVYAGCTRAVARRWSLIIAALIAWLVWFVKYDRSAWRPPAADRLSGSELATRVVDGIRASFDGLGFANRYLGALLLVLFLVHLGWRLIQGLTAATNAITWSCALIAWWAWLAASRGTLIESNAMPYVFVGSVFIVLALMPPTKLALPRWMRSPVAALAVLLAAAVIIAANRGAITDQADALRAHTLATRQTMVVAGLNVLLVPDNTPLGPTLGNLTAKQYRALVEQYGEPKGISSTNADVSLVHMAGYKLTPTPAPPCRRPISRLQAGPNAKVVISTRNAQVPVALRRFGTTEVLIGHVPAHAAATVVLAGGPSSRKWTVTAPGACITATSVAASAPATGGTSQP